MHNYIFDPETNGILLLDGEINPGQILQTASVPGMRCPSASRQVPQLRRWCVGEFGIDTNAVRKWEKTGRIPPYARQKLIMRWPERFHDIEFSSEAS